MQPRLSSSGTTPTRRASWISLFAKRHVQTAAAVLLTDCGARDDVCKSATLYVACALGGVGPHADHRTLA